MAFIARLLCEFYRKAGKAYAIDYDHESMLITVDDTIRHGICLVGPSSCAGAHISLFPSNCEMAVASVKFWYFRNPREIEIFDALARECLRQGATHIDASSHFPDNVIGRFYAKRGLKPTETLYLGRLESCCKPEAKAVRAPT